MKKFLALLLVLAFVCGCSQPLKTLMRVSSEQESHHKFIQEQDRKFQLLLDDIEAKKLKLGLSSKQVLAAYGQPIYVKEVEGQKRFLYRKPMEFNPLKKVYLYFDRQDKLGDFELVVKEPKEESPEVPQEEALVEPQQESAAETNPE